MIGSSLLSLASQLLAPFSPLCRAWGPCVSPCGSNSTLFFSRGAASTQLSADALCAVCVLSLMLKLEDVALRLWSWESVLCCLFNHFLIIVDAQFVCRALAGSAIDVVGQPFCQNCTAGSGSLFCRFLSRAIWSPLTAIAELSVYECDLGPCTTYFVEHIGSSWSVSSCVIVCEPFESCSFSWQWPSRTAFLPAPRATLASTRTTGASAR
jgi:hypothetical protein